MKAMRRIGAAALLLSSLSALAAEPLMKEARVSEADARASALASVPGGSVKSRELEKEGGRLIWTFDIARPPVRGMTEVHVDAKTGKVIAVKKETAAQEAAEAKAER